MSTVKIVAIALIVLGVVALIWQGITYSTTEHEMQIGDVELQAQEKETIPLPPILGVVALAGGVLLLLFGDRKGS